ncbi:MULTISPECIES: hypothetical protein [unclassified Duganella]|uniref:NHL domain-containing protein n=1 Tax=unclassified Duganella TaxID=2636909 RepID=UPI000E34DFBC|nr:MULTISPECIES: hypothetical protein [unclassified Duganella]
MRLSSRLSPAIPTLLLATALTACGGGSSGTSAPPVPPTVTLAAVTTQTLAGGKPVALTATVSSSDAVSWSLAAGAAGTLSATSGASVNYLPPAAGVAKPATVTVTATAGGVSKNVNLALYPDPGPAGLSLIAGSIATPTAQDADLDGPNAGARFRKPTQLAVDADGNLYVADDARSSGAFIGGHGLSLRQVTASATSTVFQQYDGVNTVSGLAVDRNHQFYISEVGIQSLENRPKGGALRKWQNNSFTTLSGGYVAPWLDYQQVDGPAASAQFQNPVLLGVDADGTLYIRDNDKLRQLTAAGVVSTIPSLPAGIVSAPDGATYTVDAASAVVYRVAADGGKTVVAGVPNVQGTVLGSLPGGLYQPQAIVPTGLYSFAVISGNAIVKLVLPH